MNNATHVMVRDTCPGAVATEMSYPNQARESANVKSEQWPIY